jgi:hypothetical protein
MDIKEIEKQLNEVKEEFLDNSDLDKEDYKYKIKYVDNSTLKITNLNTKEKDLIKKENNKFYILDSKVNKFTEIEYNDNSEIQLFIELLENL